jgi:DNA-binding transcriptional MerR regulator
MTAPGRRPMNFTIGALSRQSRVSIDSVRFYELEGLLRPAGKTPSGYRLYTESAVRRLAFIRRAQEYGFSLSEIRGLLELRRSGQSCCDDVFRLSMEKKLTLEEKIRALTAMSQALNELIERCARGAKPRDECPILYALEANPANSRHRTVSPMG